jgi:hypothetical protein
MPKPTLSDKITVAKIRQRCLLTCIRQLFFCALQRASTTGSHPQLSL